MCSPQSVILSPFHRLFLQHSFSSVSCFLIPLLSFQPPPSSCLSSVPHLCLLAFTFLCYGFILPPFALISQPLPITAGWDSGKYPTDLNHTLPWGSRGRPCRRTEAIMHRSANMVRVEKTNCYENKQFPANIGVDTFQCNRLFYLSAAWRTGRSPWGEGRVSRLIKLLSITILELACSYQ